MRGLIGYTGFVGSTLLRQTTFDRLYNSKNINDIKGEKFKFLICAGASAVKWKANKFPEEDLASIELLISNLKEVECDEFVLISTVDVYNAPNGVNESTEIDINSLSPYGKHRYMLEKFANQHFPKVTILRLPGLFGTGLKKNVIYDFIHDNCIDLIHSENVFQFYNLERLYKDLQIVLKSNISLVNLATEPVSVNEVSKYAFDKEFNQITDNNPVFYDMRTLYSDYFNSNNKNYISSKKEVLEDIRKFVENELKLKGE
ncbi:NAD-dependent epimerase/dehydratase family protein [Bacillus sp. V33-4]|uniref:NAD-dependent epimerase/dehydratase family protein n=1 Tax=Bacillus sp. V33-4 TaxID=2054169 RepID=UPI000C774455|nr:NAD-dependent epimerase/dehydratase family protein [Bacillus sp. V33-4]PLR84336.1 pyridine nucleotide transhydrogenase [Bacillus sp. V33-4]